MEKNRYLQGKKTFDFKLCQDTIPDIGNSQVLVHVLFCGVCGTDVHILRNFTAYTPLGHEISARVVKIGPDVTLVREGDLVVVEDVTFCGCCVHCHNGRTDLCQNKRTLNGQSGMGEFLLVDESLIVPANGADPLSAALTEPLAVAMNAVMATRLIPAGNLAIMGLGALGIMSAAMAHNVGAGKVILVGSRRGNARNAARERLARKMGADEVFYSSDTALEDKVKESASGRIDAVLVTSPPETLPTALSLAGYGAPVVALGVAMDGTSSVSVDVDRLIFNKNAIIPVLAEPARFFPQCLQLIKNGSIDAASFVTHQFGLETTGRLKEAYETDTGIVKAVFSTKD